MIIDFEVYFLFLNRGNRENSLSLEEYVFFLEKRAID